MIKNSELEHENTQKMKTWFTGQISVCLDTVIAEWATYLRTNVAIPRYRSGTAKFGVRTMLTDLNGSGFVGLFIAKLLFLVLLVVKV